MEEGYWEHTDSSLSVLASFLKEETEEQEISSEKQKSSCIFTKI